MWSVFSKVLEERTRTTDKLEAWHRRLQEIIVRPRPDFDTFLKVICEEWIFIKTNIKKHLAKLKIFEVAKKTMLDREERIKRIIFNMAAYQGMGLIEILFNGYGHILPTGLKQFI